MSSTSVHLPPDLVTQLDHLAASRGTSRNRIILMACEQLLNGQRGEWPAGFFDSALSAGDQALLREAGQEMENEIYDARRQRPVPPL